MISCRLQGGLGNQMFQIATTYSMALDNNDTCCFDFDACYTPNQGETATKYKEVFFKNVTDQKGFNYQKYYTETGFIYRDIEYDNNLLLNGSFQSHRYFHHNFEKIIEIITIPDSYKNKVYDVFGDLLMSNKPLVSVHIRRGDYLSKPDYHYNLPKEYYDRSIENLKDCNFIFISDDMNWVKENFNGDNFFFSESQDEIFDFTLMYLCNTNIIANSSFSWWAAYLNHKNKNIITPNKWLGINAPEYKLDDLYLSDWTIINLQDL